MSYRACSTRSAKLSHTPHACCLDTKAAGNSGFFYSCHALGRNDRGLGNLWLQAEVNWGIVSDRVEVPPAHVLNLDTRVTCAQRAREGA